MLNIAGGWWFFGMRKQPVKHGIWHIDGRKRRQTSSSFPVAALSAPLLGNLGGVIFKKIF